MSFYTDTEKSICYLLEKNHRCYATSHLVSHSKDNLSDEEAIFKYIVVSVTLKGKGKQTPFPDNSLFLNKSNIHD